MVIDGNIAFMICFENRENGRFYYMKVGRDALNDLVLTVIRGGLRSSVIRHFGFNCKHTLQREIDKLAKRRLQRGYSLVTSMD